MTIGAWIEKGLAKNWAMAAYRIPGNLPVFLAGEALTGSFSIDQPGFIMAPFSSTDQDVTIIPLLQIDSKTRQVDDTLQHSLPAYSFPQISQPHNQSQAEYLESLTKAQENAYQRGIQKFIFSRVKWVDSPVFSPASAFEKLCAAYPDAFVYYLQHPTAGKWMGASPEILLTRSGSRVETTSLAGTRPAGSTGEWGDKEIEEQALVTEYIQQLLQRHHIPFEALGPATRIAGPVEHLQTHFTAELPAEMDLAALIRSLHPTPAVCGIPKEKALDLIQRSEEQTRAYYTGFLGTVHTPENLHLYVNLRCMQIFENGLALRLGGGITAASVPQQEWEETEYKSQTLLRVLA